MTKITKVMRYQIIKPLGDDWETLGRVLSSIQRETRVALNRTIQLAWEWQGFSAEYKEKTGHYPKPREIIEKKSGGTIGSLAHYAYDQLKEVCNKINTQNLSQTIKRANDKWKSDLKDILKGDKSIPAYKKECPIDIVAQAYTLKLGSEGYELQSSLMSRSYAKEAGREYGYFTLLLGVHDKNQKVILERIISGEYKAGVSQIIRAKGKWFVNLTYSFDKESIYLDLENIMGIDMGIVFPVYLAFNNSRHRYKVDGGEIERFRRQLERRRNQLLGHGKYCGEGRRGHGIKTRIKPIEANSEKIANFRDSCNHKYSRFVVDMAIKHRCGTIQVEDLSGIKQRETFLRNWPYFDLQKKIEYKAKEAGIQVIYVSPSYTSQRCSECGYIHKDNRLNQADFICMACGFKGLADYNAARNIATRGIGQIIKEYFAQNA